MEDGRKVAQKTNRKWLEGLTNERSRAEAKALCPIRAQLLKWKYSKLLLATKAGNFSGIDCCSEQT